MSIFLKFDHKLSQLMRNNWDEKSDVKGKDLFGDQFLGFFSRKSTTRSGKSVNIPSI